MDVQRCAHRLSEQEVQESLLAELALPAPAVDTVELEDARWFHLSWLECQRRKAGTLPPEAAELLIMCLMSGISRSCMPEFLVTSQFSLTLKMK